MPEMPATLANSGNAAADDDFGRRGRSGLCRCLMRRPALRILIAAQNTRSGSGDQQEQRRRGRGLQAGKVVQDALAQLLIPALGRQRVERFVEAQAGAGDEIWIRLHDGMRIGEHFERQHLLPLLLALPAAGHMALELVHLLVGELPIRRRYDPFVCKFAIHSHVLLASKKTVHSSSPPFVLAIRF